MGALDHAPGHRLALPRWITPPPHATRTIPSHDRNAASAWGIKALDLD
jgi:hypothetical protein